MKFKELSNHQIKALTDLRQAYAVYLDEKSNIERFKGSMKWKRTSSGEYLIRVLDSKGTERSLGRKSPETEATYLAFNQGKAAHAERLKSLSASLAELCSIAKVLGVGRMPSVVGKVLRRLDEEGLLGNHLLVVGTHALYGYEAAAGVQFDSEMLATADIDLMIDSRKRLKLIANPQSPLEPVGVLSVLCKADKTFKKIAQQTFRAANNDGFMVDLIKPMPQPAWAGDALTKADSNDLDPIEVPQLGWLLSAPKFEAVCVDVKGQPARMVCPDPRAFAIHKKWLSAQYGREPEKKSRDSMQARAVIELTAEKFPHLPLRTEELKNFPNLVVKKHWDDFDL